ncbi:hypothetical protein N644_1537 [Lactiplantibacillus paraplantarum]|nr:hypothetical protein N644_1537 [Lactiplantibacillus paraplantarum]
MLDQRQRVDGDWTLMQQAQVRVSLGNKKPSAAGTDTSS